jgi:hypothetical protein
LDAILSILTEIQGSGLITMHEDLTKMLKEMIEIREKYRTR